MKELENKLNEMLVTKAPFQLPDNFRTRSRRAFQVAIAGTAEKFCRRVRIKDVFAQPGRGSLW